MSLVWGEGGLVAPTQIEIAVLDVPRLVNQEKVARYALMLDRLPPIVVFDVGGDSLVVDGYHRINAARLLGRPTINAQICRGTWDDAVVFAARALAAERGLATEEALGTIRWHMGSGRAMREPPGRPGQVPLQPGDGLYCGRCAARHPVVAGWCASPLMGGEAAVTPAWIPVAPRADRCHPPPHPQTVTTSAASSASTGMPLNLHG